MSGLVLGGMLAGVAPQVASSAPLARSTPEVFAGTASATALKLGLFGTNLTVSTSNVEADAGPKAHADGAGVALIAATVSGADSSGAGQSSQPARACGLHLPLASLLTLDLACSQSATQTTNAAPAAIATSNIAALDVQALSTILNLLQPILSALTPIADQVIGTVITTVQSVVQPLLGNLLPQLLTGLGVQPTAPVSSLITALEKATNLVEVHVGDTVSQVVTSAGSVVADSDAQGATISVLPALGAGLLTITVGAAHTTSTFNRTTGASVATFNPAILSIKLLGNTIPIGLGAPITLFAGTPLESTISLGAGSTTTNADGSVTAVADGVGIDLLKGISGGISLHLAHAESAAGGHLAVVTAATTTTTAAPVINITPQAAVRAPTLATTGTDTPLLPIGAFLILAGYVSRRTIRARRAARAPR